MKFRSLTNNFLFGEISRKARARTDIPEYNKSCQLMERFIPYVNGGASKSPGTRFIKDMGSTVAPGVLPFVVDKTLGYYVTLDPTRANAGKYIRIFKVDGTEMTVDETLFLAADNVISIFPTTIDPRGFVFATLGDSLFITHNSGTQMPFIVFRTGDTTFEVTPYYGYPAAALGPGSIDGVLKQPYRDVNVSSVTMTPSAVAAGTQIVTASAAFFNLGHVGSYLKLTQAGVTGTHRIISYTSPIIVNTAPPLSLAWPALTATTDWEEQAWSDYRGWPKAVTIFEERMVWGGVSGEGDTIRGSLAGNVFHLMGRKYQQDLAADVSGLNYFGADLNTDPYAFVVGADNSNAIQWLAPSNSLYVGTLAEEYAGNGGQEILGPLSPGFKSQTGYGSSPTKVVKVGNEILYVSRDGRKVRTFRFSDENGSNLSFDLSYLADHMSRLGGDSYGFIDASYQQSRDTIWYINANNYLVGLTYSRETGALAWHRHPIKDSQGIMGIATIPNAEGNFDTTAIIVKRTINSSVVYYLEIIGAPYEAESLGDTGTLEEDIPMFLDSSKTEVLGGTTDTLTGYIHLIGEVVTVTKDGYFYGSYTVSGTGTIVLVASWPVNTRFVVGLPYTAYLTLNPVQGGGDFGADEGSLKSLDTAFLDLYKTYDCEITTTSLPLNLLPLSFETDLKTEIVEKQLENSQSLENAVVIKSENPYPCNILFIVSRGEGND